MNIYKISIDEKIIVVKGTNYYIDNQNIIISDECNTVAIVPNTSIITITSEEGYKKEFIQGRKVEPISFNKIQQ